MNTFWLKIMGLAVLALAVIIAISFFTPATDSQSPEPEPEEPQKTFYDQAEEDKQKFLTEPQALDAQTQTPPTEQIPPIENQTPVQTAQKAMEPPRPAQPTVVYFKELDEIDQIEASRLLNAAAPGRSIGRLPMTGYKLMVDQCRTIISKWPDSQFAYKAKMMLADLPERYQMRYKVTEEEKDLSMFTQQRPGTKPFTIMEDPR
ncbi:MAG: hypothetical protein RQ760_04245 [Sedimentisphaerales bacterium]|nr:hypothetical protein [Sedimentisphaerales bacterium]